MEFLAGVTFGFLGSLHCVGMCGPIVLSMPRGESSRFRFSLGRLLYHLGRVLTYTLLGAVIGLFGGNVLLPVFQRHLSIVVGATVLLAALLPSVFRRLSPAGLLAPLTGAVTGRIAGLMRRQSPVAMGMLGLLNGLLPCGFVYLAIAGAMVSASVAGGMTFMAGFGIGTVPAMLLVSLFPGFLPAGMRMKLTRLMPAVSVVVAVLLIVRGLNLGIPYLSPHFKSATVEHAAPDCCHEE